MLDVYMIILRIIHFFAGVFWVGGTFFFLSVVSPTVRDAGPDGVKFMQQLAAGGRMTRAYAVAAILSSLSGLLMYWQDSNHLNPALLRTSPFIVLTISGVAGLLALGHGLFATRPVSDRLGGLAKTIMAQGGRPTPEQLQEAQSLGAKLGKYAVQTAVIMVVTLLGMATWRSFSF